MRPKTFDEVLVAVGGWNVKRVRGPTHLVVVDIGLEVGVSLGEERQDVVRLVGGEGKERSLVAEPHGLRPFEDAIRRQLIVRESILYSGERPNLDRGILAICAPKPLETRASATTRLSGVDW